MKTKASFPWAFAFLAVGFSWVVLAPGVLATYHFLTLPVPTLALIAIAQFGSSIAAFVLTYRDEGRAGVVRLFKRALNFHIRWMWLAVIVFLPLGLAAVSLYLNVQTGGQLPALLLLAQPAAIPFVFLFIFFLQGPVPEEFGWRGYMLDRLQSRWSAVASSLILGVVWGIYHLPVFFLEGASLATIPLWAWFIQVLAVAVLTTWLYNNTGRNLLAAMLFHGMVNLSVQVLPPFDLRPGADPRGFFFETALYVVAAGLVAAFWGTRTLTRWAGNPAAASR